MTLTQTEAFILNTVLNQVQLPMIARNDEAYIGAKKKLANLAVVAKERKPKKKTPEASSSSED
ncbi:hypothetical protein N9937_00610 [bacterium]|nr:hypothetical protein [bacterium]